MEHLVIFTIDDKPHITDGNIWLQNVEDGSLHKARLTEELKEIVKSNCPSFVLPPDNVHEIINSSSNCDNNDMNLDMDETVESVSNKKWDRNSTEQLISLRKQYSSLFESNSIKNDSVWDKITSKMKGYTRAQVKDRWQYLRRRYLKKKENMSARKTGEETVKFEYFADIDDILGQKPNISPQFIASSSRGLESTEEATDSSEMEENLLVQLPKKIKKIKNNDTISNFLKTYTERSAEKEESRIRRHNENMEMKKKTLEMISEKFDKLIDKL